MANQNQVLQALSSVGGVVATEDLATNVGTTQDTIRALCSKLKTKDFVDGSTKEGWTITSEGREVLERGLKIPTTQEDVGADTESKFKYYGKLAGVDPDRILATTEAIFTGDPENLDHVWEVMTQMDIPMPNRRRWFNSWRYYLKQGIPVELREKVIGSPDEEKGEALSFSAKERGRDYIIVDEEPVRVGAGLGDYGLQDAKDVLSIRALRNRFAGGGQSGGASMPGTGEKVSDLLRELAPYLNKGGNDETLRELISTQMELQKQEILSHIPQPVQGGQPKSVIDQIAGFVAALGSLREAGPLLRSILGVPESSGNPLTPTQIIGLDGQPAVMDLTKALDMRRFLGEEKRADERHDMFMGIGKAARENVGTFAEAAKEAIAEGREERKGQAPGQGQQEGVHMFRCNTPSCQKEFGIRPEDWPKLETGELSGVPCPHCGAEYTAEMLTSA